jgi:hypothetical protein
MESVNEEALAEAGGLAQMDNQIKTALVLGAMIVGAIIIAMSFGVR